MPALDHRFVDAVDAENADVPLRQLGEELLELRVGRIYFLIRPTARAGGRRNAGERASQPSKAPSQSGVGGSGVST